MASGPPAGETVEIPLAGEATKPPVPPFWNVPNGLTLARLVLSAVVFALIDQAYYRSALGVFVVAAATDALDGYFARLLNQVSAIGRQLDPLVDKVIVAGVLIYLLPLPAASTGLYPWMVTTIVVRELVVQALRSLVEGRGVAFGARVSGKLKTVLQCSSIVGILLILGLGDAPHTGLLWARDLLTWGAVGLTIYSGVIYLVAAWPYLKGSPSPR
jgi:CDP-diacylglycerol--glycerol-3-phosphate 3-phosphatidyltransferase